MTTARAAVHDVQMKTVANLALLLFWMAGVSAAEAPPAGQAAVNGTRLAYQVAGSGETVVLLHGAFVDGRMWDAQFAELAKQYRVVRYDQRGHGRSARNHTQPHSPLEDLHALLEHLEIARAHLVGFSAGGHIAIDYALAHPERVLSLILVEPAVGGVPYDGESAAAMVELVGIARGGNQAEAARRAAELPFLQPLAKARPAEHKRLAQVIAEHAFQFDEPKNLTLPEPPASERLGEIKVPTLVMISEFADSHARKVADLLQQRIGPTHRVAIGGSGHVINLERPPAFTRAVDDFLAGVVAARRAAARLEAPRVLAVMFHADWCPTCKVIEPRLQKIEREFAGQPILFTQFDLTDDFTIEQSARFAALLGLESYLEQSSGRTGYMLLFDASNKKLLGEVRVKMSDDEIRAAMRQALDATAKRSE